MPAPELTFEAPLEEWRLVYRVLHASLTRHLELLDVEFLSALQKRLQEEATRDGVDVSHHAAWDAWLGNTNAPFCEDRVARRTRLGEDEPGN